MNDTNSISLLQQMAAQMPAQWHGFTFLHGLVALIGTGWITHANWPKIISTLQWFRTEGGFIPVVWSFIWNNPNPKPAS